MHERLDSAKRGFNSLAIRFIWVGGVHGWRAGLKNRERWFDYTPTHQLPKGNREVSRKLEALYQPSPWTIEHGRLDIAKLSVRGAQDAFARP